MTERKPTRTLVAAAQKKDHAAFEELFERYRSRLLYQIQARMGINVQSKVGPEDILQETLMRAFRAIEKFRWQGEESFYRWLASIAEHLIRNAAQKKTSGQLHVDLPVSQNPPSKELRRNERFDRLEQALNGLTADQRKAIVLARIDGLKVKEIAQRMERSESAVHKLMARAILGLKRSIGDTESLSLPDRKLHVDEDRDAR